MSTVSEAERHEQDADWYERWFGEEYLHLYPHRDREEARRAVRLVLDHFPAGEGSGRALDLACGAGRHLAELRTQGIEAFGLDLSFHLLARAREERLPVLRADMRVLPFRRASLSLVTSFFTSFGYFDDPADDEEVLAEVQRVLEPGGTFALDYLNAGLVRADLQPRTERVVNGRRVTETRRLIEGGHVVEKEIEIRDPGQERPRVYHERVRLYDADELLELFARHGFAAVECFGDYHGGPLAPDCPRVIVLGRRR